jgi:molybdopterin-guanine dinucleotide biosynthesis protein A
VLFCFAMIDAIVLAGGGREAGLPPGLPNKAFIEIAGRPLVGHVVDALRRAQGVGRVAAVGPAELRSVLPRDVTLVPDAGEIMDNVTRAVELLRVSSMTLAAASDLPLLSAPAIEEFLTICEQQRADFFYPIVPKEAVTSRFPTVRKTYVTLAEGTFCGSGVMLFNAQVLDRVKPFVERIIAARKKPWQMAQMFGWSIIMKFFAGTLSIDEVVTRATEIVGIVVKPIIVARPELALDIDVGKPENLAAIREEMERRE